MGAAHESFAGETSAVTDIGTVKVIHFGISAYESSQVETSAVDDIGTVNVSGLVIRSGNPFAFCLRPSPLGKILRRSCPSPYEMGRSSTPGTFQRALIFLDRFVMSRVFSTRGLSREGAANFIGVGVTKFDQMVADGRMPAPKLIDSRRVWCVYEIDAAFDALPSTESSSPPLVRKDRWMEFSH